MFLNPDSILLPNHMYFFCRYRNLLQVALNEKNCTGLNHMIDFLLLGKWIFMSQIVLSVGKHPLSLSISPSRCVLHHPLLFFLIIISLCFHYYCRYRKSKVFYLAKVSAVWFECQDLWFKARVLCIFSFLKECSSAVYLVWQRFYNLTIQKTIH